MTSAATLLHDARIAADLSIRALAERSDIAGSTVLRIEAGQVDPGIGTLTRLLAACGRELELGARRSSRPRVAGLADAWAPSASGEPTPDWTRWRALLDYVALHPEHRGPATLDAPAPSGSAIIDNLLAAMAETICDDAGLPRPRWTRHIQPLSTAWTTPGTPRMQARAEQATPPAFAARHITLRRDSLWRDPSSVGA